MAHGGSMMPVQLRRTVATAVLVLAASATAQPASRAILTGYVDRNGRVVEPATWEGGSDPVAGDWVAVTRAGKTGFLNLRTHATTGFKFDGTAADNARALFADGPEPVQVGRLWGYADDAGALVITPQFAEARPFGADGLAIAIADVGGVRRQGMIDHTGRWVIPARSEQLRRFSGGLAVFARGDRYGAIDRTGREVIAPAFTMLQDFADNGLAGATLDIRSASTARRGGAMWIGPAAGSSRRSSIRWVGSSRTRLTEDSPPPLD